MYNCSFVSLYFMWLLASIVVFWVRWLYSSSVSTGETWNVCVQMHEWINEWNEKKKQNKNYKRNKYDKFNDNWMYTCVLTYECMSLHLWMNVCKYVCTNLFVCLFFR